MVEPLPAVTPGDESADLWFNPYQMSDISDITVASELRAESLQTLSELVAAIVSVEAPIHVDLVIERIRLRYGIGRVRGSTRDHVRKGIRFTVWEQAFNWIPEEVGGKLERETFLGISGQDHAPRPRAPVDGQPRRVIEHIPLAELKAGALLCANLIYGAPRDGLIAETARQFGFNRTGAGIVRRIGEAVDQLVKEGKLTGSSDMLSVAG